MADTNDRHLFISHSAMDHEVLQDLVDCLRLGAGLRQSDYFASSLDGSDITVGSDFKEFMRERLSTSSLSLLLVSPAYLDSTFCAYELGASWVMASTVFPLMVPPLEPEQFEGPLSNPQAARLTAKGLDDLVDAVVAHVPGCERAKDWERHRDDALVKIRGRLPVVSESWKTTAQAKLRQESRYATVTQSLQRFLDKVSEASQAWNRHDWPPRPAFQTKERQNLQRQLDDCARLLAELFSSVCSQACNVTVKSLVFSEGQFFVRDIARNGTGRRRLDPVTGNTDFESLFDGDEPYFSCNDIPALQASGTYQNTHTRPDGSLPYRSTIVWPISAMVPGEGDAAGYLVPDVKAFLCLDAAQVGAFTAREIELGLGVASLLHPLLSPYLEEREP